MCELDARLRVALRHHRADNGGRPTELTVGGLRRKLADESGRFLQSDPSVGGFASSALASSGSQPITGLRQVASQAGPAASR